MDQIRLTGVRAVGKHGVLDFEHERAQTFVVDATLFLDLAPAGHSDDLHDTVDYGAIAKGIVAIIEGDHVDLIEKLADRIASMILEYPAVARTQVTVHKPSAPIVVPFDDVSVTVERSRETTSAASQVHHAIIAMGGNQGDVVATLRDAVRSIDGLASTQVTGISPLYRTDAWGMPDGTPDFYNAVVSVTTKLSAMELLRGLQRIEAEHGRVRTDHWTSRTLDLDIIDFDGQSSDDPDLTLPHPRAWQRAFVLGPWLALEPDAELPGDHAGSVAQLLHESTDRDHIDEIADDWMVGGSVGDGIADHADDTDDADDMGESYSTIDASDLPEGTAAAKAAASASVQSGPASRRAVISLDSPATDAEQQFRMAIVTLDGIPGNQVEGISPLYHVSQLDGLPDKMAAVIQISTRMGAHDLIEALSNVEASVGEDFDLDLIDMEGVACDEPDCKVPWPTARNHARAMARHGSRCATGQGSGIIPAGHGPRYRASGTADRQLDHRRYAMKARRTPWWCYVLAAALGLLAGMGLAKYGEISGLPLVGAPWIVPVVLTILGFVVLYMALQIHKYTTTDPEKRAQLKPLDPQKAFATLVSCKALGVAGAALSGWYGGQLIMSLPHGEATFYSQAILECAIAAIVCIADMIIGIVGEWLCQIPPIDGPESPKMKTATQRNRYAAAATKSATQTKA